MLKKIRLFFGARQPFRTKCTQRSKKMQDLIEKSGLTPDDDPPFRVVITSGLGYGNVGDEAQAAATVERWQKLVPNSELLLLSPNPEYTEKTHQVRSSWASRSLWFHSNCSKIYWNADTKFKLRFALTWFRQTITARFIRAGVPLSLSSPEETLLLKQIRDASVLHISGGGFLTGMTLSRLWDFALVMRLCQLFNTPYILTGQTIGVFQTSLNRWLAKQSLGKANIIYLRDEGISENELKSIGISGNHVKSTFDDAVFFESLTTDAVNEILRENGIDPSKPYFIANFHYWGQSDEMKQQSSKRFAELTDTFIEKTGTQVLFVPMTPTDIEAEKDVIQIMKNPGYLLNYKFDYKTARGVYKLASFVFTMKHHPIVFGYGEGIPVMSIALDDYYYHKNKGAMANCGHERFCLNSDMFFKPAALEHLDAFLTEKNTLTEEVCQWVHQSRPIALEPLERIIKEISQNKN